MPDEWSTEERNYAAKVACKIVSKFPQIEQAVLAPLLMIEIGHAILDALSAGKEQI